MNHAEKEKFLRLRSMVGNYIEEYLKDDCGHKSYEGTWELTVCYPSYFDDETFQAGPEVYVVVLHCYVLGPGRHYDWHGKSWLEALEKAEADISSWVEDLVDS